MKIAAISSNTPVMKLNSKKQSIKTENNDSGVPSYPPVVVGVVNGLCWGMVGYAFDKVCSKLFGYKSSNRMSLAINGIIGSGMGIYSFIQAKKCKNNLS